VSDLPRLTGGSAVVALADLAGASIAAGAIARRRPVVGLLERCRADSRAIERMRLLRRQFGRGPVELMIPGRRILLLLEPADVERVLAETPIPFHPATWEKRRALEKFQPHGVLISRGPVRAERRQLNEAALETTAPLHHLAADFSRAIGEEVAVLAEEALKAARLDSADFTRWWWRLVRRLVLGDAARDDDAITDDLWRLRKSGNWSFLGLSHTQLRERFIDRLYAYTELADPHSLIGRLSRLPVRASVDPIGQVPHWLFAFDAAGMAALRTAAVLAARPEEQSRCETDGLEEPQLRPFLRACVLESVRLWPTTPALLRELTGATTFTDGGRFAAGSSVLIVTPAFHRDPDLLPFADDFVPEIWLDGRAQQYPQLVPFSGGPAECPGRNLVLFVTSTVIAHLFSMMRLELQSSPSLDHRPLPVTLNQFGVKLRAVPRAPAGSSEADRAAIAT
jgi:cytochrome P450